MGSSCCCFGVHDIDVLANENGSNHHGNCLCFSFCLQGLVNKYHALFERGNPVPTSDQEAAPSHSQGADNSSSATRSSDTTLSIDQNPRYSLVPGDGVVRGQDRGSSHSRVQPEPFTEAVQQQPKLLKMEDKLVNAHQGGESKECCSDSSLKVLSSMVKDGFEYFIPSEEDEDVCPTCLEEYTEENPKIITHCAHHYHLSCIYEWMERSETCPVCGKLMEFDE